MEFTITVHGRPVARLYPPERSPDRRVDVDSGTVARLLEDTPVDPEFAQDIDTLRGLEAPVEDPWPKA